MEVNFRYLLDHLFQPKIRKLLVLLLEVALTIGLGAVLSLLFCQTVVIQDSSMNPSFEISEKCLVNRLAYHLHKPARGDVIAFRTSSDEKASTQIKRVIGLPGDRIQIVNGNLMINEESYLEKRDVPAMVNAGLASETITLERGEYFVLGDNRNNSEDSRFAGIGNVKEDNIVGKLWFVISPVNRIGFIGS